MKKKIKDMTREEFNDMCNTFPSNCKGCPLEWMTNCYTIRDYLKAHEMEKALEQEVEVKEDGKSIQHTTR